MDPNKIPLWKSVNHKSMQNHQVCLCNNKYVRLIFKLHNLTIRNIFIFMNSDSGNTYHL